MAVADNLYTVETFLEIAHHEDNADKRLELIDGEISEMAPSRPINAVIAVRLSAALLRYADDHEAGYVTGADGGYVLGEDTVLIPDAAFIAKSRHPELTGNLFPVAPDLAVEVVSPGKRERQVWNKVRKYLGAGTKMVWVIYPDDKTIDVHHPTEDGGVLTHTLGISDTLRGGEALPGFSLAVADVFPK